MDLAVLNAFLTVLLAAISIYLVFSTKRQLKKFESLADSVGQLFRYEEDEDGQPLLDARLVKILEALGSSLSKSLQMSFLGKLSGQARLEKGLKSAMTQDLIDNQMPILNLIGDFLGINTKKYIAKHPEAFMQLAQQFLPMIMKSKFNQAPTGELGGIT